METRLWVISFVLLVFSLVFSLFNWACLAIDLAVWIGICKRVRAPSIIPILGGLFGTIGFLTMPSNRAIWVCWIPLLWDYGSLPVIGLAVISHFYRKRRRNA